MQSTEQRNLDEMEREAARRVELQEYDKAEPLYRDILRQRLKVEGLPAIYADMYNLGRILVKNQKYEEALPVLRELFVCVSQRTTNQENPDFSKLEADTAQLLAQSLEGQRQLSMAKDVKGTEEGVDFSDSSDDDENTDAGEA